MKPFAEAMISWVPQDQGGRKQIPPGPVYRGVARFEDDRDRWPNEAWSIVVTLLRPYGKRRHGHLAKVSFLSDEAPHEMLRSGARFSLMEGDRVVAKGVVLENGTEVPEEIDDFSLALLG